MLYCDSHMKELLYEVRYLKSSEDMISHLLDNLSNCLMNLNNSRDSTGFEPMTSAMPVQCSNQVSYEVTQFSSNPRREMSCFAVVCGQSEHYPRRCALCWPNDLE